MPLQAGQSAESLLCIFIGRAAIRNFQTTNVTSHLDFFSPVNSYVDLGLLKFPNLFKLYNTQYSVHLVVRGYRWSSFRTDLELPHQRGHNLEHLKRNNVLPDTCSRAMSE